MDSSRIDNILLFIRRGRIAVLFCAGAIVQAFEYYAGPRRSFVWYSQENELSERYFHAINRYLRRVANVSFPYFEIDPLTSHFCWTIDDPEFADERLSFAQRDVVLTEISQSVEDFAGIGCQHQSDPTYDPPMTFPADLF